MQHDLSTMTPATRAVFDAVHYLGQGNVHELAEQSGKARSTVDKAIKALSDARLITPVDTGADIAEGVPTRWALAEGIAETVTADNTDPDTHSGLADADADPGSDTEYTSDSDSDGEPDPDPLTDDDNPPSVATPDSDAPADRDGSRNNPDGDRDAQDDAAADHPHDMVDAHTDNDWAATGHDLDGSGGQNAVSSGQHDTDSDHQDVGEAPGWDGAAVAKPSRPGDRKVMTIKAVLAEHGDGATLDEIAQESGIHPATVSRLLSAMEQADAARLLDGKPLRWIVGPTKAAEVDPNPLPERCPVCLQIVKAHTDSPDAMAVLRSLMRPDGTLHIAGADGATHVVALPTRLPIRRPSTATTGAFRQTDFTVNSDGSQPFAKGELDKLTLAALTAKPGRAMTPQEIATAISAQLGGRTISSGAVRNNCTKAAAAGRIEMVSDAPLTFAYPVPAGDSETSDTATGDSSETRKVETAVIEQS